MSSLFFGEHKIQRVYWIRETLRCIGTTGTIFQHLYDGCNALFINDTFLCYLKKEKKKKKVLFLEFLDTGSFRNWSRNKATIKNMKILDPSPQKSKVYSTLKLFQLQLHQTKTTHIYRRLHIVRVFPFPPTVSLCLARSVLLLNPAGSSIGTILVTVPYYFCSFHLIASPLYLISEGKIKKNDVFCSLKRNFDFIALLFPLISRQATKREKTEVLSLRVIVIWIFQ